MTRDVTSRVMDAVAAPIGTTGRSRLPGRQVKPREEEKQAPGRQIHTTHVRS